MEWVVLVSPQLTKDLYQLLTRYDPVVSRTWHLDGRYGSRTHRFHVQQQQKLHRHNQNHTNGIRTTALTQQEHQQEENDGDDDNDDDDTKVFNTDCSIHSTIKIKNWRTCLYSNKRTSSDAYVIGIPIRSKLILLLKAEIVNESILTDDNEMVFDLTELFTQESNNNSNDSNEDTINTTISLDASFDKEKKELYRKRRFDATTTSTSFSTSSNELHNFLVNHRNDIKVIYKLYTPTNRNYVRPPFDASIHPERQVKSEAKENSFVLTNKIRLLQQRQKQQKQQKHQLQLQMTESLVAESLKMTSDEQPRRLSLASASSSSYSLFTYAELFAGIGGFTVALEALGGRCIFGSEIHPVCRHVYLMNFPHNEPVLYGDIYDISDDVLLQCVTNERIDILVGGFPCQPFSSLGEQPGLHDPKGILFLQIVRVLHLCQPSTFLFENVPGLLQMKDTFATIQKAFEDAGYTVSTEVIDSRGLTASSRKRLYFVGIRNSCNKNYSDVGETCATNFHVEKNVTGNNPSVNDSNHRITENCARPFEFPYIPDLGLRAGDVISYETSFDSVPTIIIDGVDCESVLRVTDSQLQRLNSEKYWKPAKMAWPDTTCNTLVSHYGTSIGRGHSQLVPTYSGNPRKFTPRECARIMGFPNSYQLPVVHNQRVTTCLGDGAGYKIHNDGLLDITSTSKSIDGCNNVDSFTYNEDQSDTFCSMQLESTKNVEHKTRTMMATNVKQQYKMIGNAVCPPVIAALAGAVLSLCCLSPSIQIQDLPSNNQDCIDEKIDWIDYGRTIAIELAHQATISP